MPCITPYRDDAAQLLLFKIASCLAAGGGGGGTAGVLSFNSRTGVVTLTSGDVTGALGFTPAASGSGVTSFNTRTGAVTLTSADVTTALGFTPLNTTTGDARYVLKTGDTMTGALAIGNGVLVASTPYLNLSQTWNNGAVTFTGLQSNVTNTASDANSNLFNFQVDGVDRFNFTQGGSFRAIRQDASNSGLNLFLRKRGNAGGATNAVASDSTIGTVAYSGWDGTAFATGSRVSGLAAEAWTNIAHGARVDIYTTPIGSVTEQLTLRVSSSGQGQFLDGTAALPAITFQSDPDTGIYRIGANSFGLSAGGSLISTVNTTGIDMTAALAYKYNAVNVIRAQTALDNYFFGPSGNLTMTGTFNTISGSGAFLVNTTGSFNVATGYQSLFSNTTGSQNNSTGYQTLRSNTTGSFNAGMGYQALFSNTIGEQNIGVGYKTLFANIDGNRNVAIGLEALMSNTTGSNNTAIGHSALRSNTTGSINVAIGYLALLEQTTATQNTVVGYNSGRGITTGSSNTIIGANVTGLAAGLANNIILADGAGVIRLQIDSSGNTTLAGTLATGDGTAALPGLAFAADTNTGIYRIGADRLGLSTAGTARWEISAAGHLLASADNTFDVGALGATRPRNIFASNNVETVARFLFTSKTVISSPSDGVLRLTNFAETDFSRLQFGGTTSSFPSIKRVSATLAFRLADDSADAAVTGAGSTWSGNLIFSSDNSFDIGAGGGVNRPRTGYFGSGVDAAGGSVILNSTGLTMQANRRISISSGTNQRAGNAVLVGGTVTVANTTVTANTIVIVTRKTAGGTIGFAVTYTVIAATSFTLTSDNALDTSTYTYLLIEVP